MTTIVDLWPHPPTHRPPRALIPYHYPHAHTTLGYVSRFPSTGPLPPYLPHSPCHAARTLHPRCTPHDGPRARDVPPPPHSSLPPTQVMVAVCSRIFDACVSTILDTNGTVDKFIGDCVMAFWGAPVAVDNAAQAGVTAVLRILAWLRDHPCALDDGTRIGFRVGVHGGQALVGNFGASCRWDYTAVGDVVNMAARLEPLNKQLGTHCLASDHIVRQLDAQDLRRQLRPMGRVLLVGKRQPVSVYEITEAPVEDVEGWTAAVADFAACNFERAAAYFKGRPPEDAPARVLLQEAREAEADGRVGECVRAMKHK